jgi:hypothetical protein
VEDVGSEHETDMENCEAETGDKNGEQSKTGEAE